MRENKYHIVVNAILNGLEPILGRFDGSFWHEEVH